MVASWGSVRVSGFRSGERKAGFRASEERKGGLCVSVWGGLLSLCVEDEGGRKKAFTEISFFPSVSFAVCLFPRLCLSLFVSFSVSSPASVFLSFFFSLSVSFSASVCLSFSIFFYAFLFSTPTKKTIDIKRILMIAITITVIKCNSNRN